MVAHHIDIVEVVGSSPISPTIKREIVNIISRFILLKNNYIYPKMIYSCYIITL